MCLVLRKDPDWPETLSTAVSGGSLTLLGGDGCQVLVPAALLVAVSPLVKSMMADLLPPAYSTHVISIPAVTGAVLLMVAEVLTKGTVVVHADNGKVQEVFKMMRIEAFISHSVADSEIKDEDLTRDCSESEIHVKIENYKQSEYYEDFGNFSAMKVENKKIESDHLGLNISPSEVLLPSNENNPEDNGIVKDCDKNIHKKNLQQYPVKKPFKCDQCAYRATRSLYLKQHMLIHRARPYPCEECNHRDVSKAGLKQHMLVHSREKSVACDQCEYRGASKVLLKVHMEIHAVEKPFSCDQCTYRAGRSGDLRKHMVIHTGEKPFACNQCDYRAVRSRNLKAHMVTHTGEKPFACDQCDFRAVRSRNLKVHMVTICV